MPERPDASPGPGSPRGRRRYVTDPLLGTLAELQTIQPYNALKSYLCPGCNQEIRARTGHLVVVPLNHPDDRRHWHKACYSRASRHGVVGR